MSSNRALLCKLVTTRGFSARNVRNSLYAAVFSYWTVRRIFHADPVSFVVFYSLILVWFRSSWLCTRQSPSTR